MARRSAEDVLDQFIGEGSDIEEYYSTSDESVQDSEEEPEATVSSSDSEDVAPPQQIPRLSRGRGRVRGRGRGRGRGIRGRHGVASTEPAHNNASYPDDPATRPEHLPCENESFRINLELDWANTTPLEVVMALLPDNFFQLIKSETNSYARQQIDAARVKGPLPVHGILSQWVPVTIGELKKFFSIVIHMGLVRKPKLHDYWSRDITISSQFAATLLSRSRWLAISSMLHLSDSTNYVPRGEDGHDPLYKINSFLTPLVGKFFTAATPGRQLSLDEAMCAFRGRVHFRVYNANKPDKWGIKLYQVCDSKTGYTSAAEVYCGVGGTTTETVMRLMTGLLDKGHTLYMDRYYNSPALTECLLSKNTQVVGTVQTNRKGLPPDIKTKKLKKGEVISFRRGRMLCLKWKDKREVSMISTIHDDSTVPVQRRGESAPVQKPVCVADYNEYMGGVDHSDQLLSYYPFKRKTLKWYKKLFYRLFYLSLTNSHILYKYQCRHLDLQQLTLYQFLKSVAKAMAEDAGTDLDQPPMSTRTVDPPTRLTERHFPDNVPDTTSKRSMRRCVVCRARSVRKETRYQCTKCDVGLCVVSCFERYHTLTKY